MAKEQQNVTSLKIKGKPKCPICGRPLNFVYDDVGYGHINEKCKNCGRSAIVDLSTLLAVPA
ncbi:hypothetical protein EQM14_01820 [Caproiciproducens sp. NJN-50]|uniref:hypothetical protein n=1 Tax=Caproiciproducens sp. NJN-50 TaxID=2507162 RepID=UPI000FFE084E|nr:hypothetical protein [Caproiciproducens sp. NJN-50]QAT48620.1 hypothetical protein EQM14_01820 [Caproiciproducens sp. NJN-50]